MTRSRFGVHQSVALTAVLLLSSLVLVGSPAEAASPQGVNGSIVFESNRTGNYDIFIMNPDGSNEVNLTNHPARDEESSVSPDGKKIAFSTQRDGDAEIYVMDRDGTDLVRLTNHAASDGNPTWSPDGTRLAFRSDREGHADIWTMDSDDAGNLVNLTANTTSTSSDPDWHPTLPKIVFQRADQSQDIWTMNADGTNQTPVFSTSYDEREPQWVALTGGIVFSSNRPGDIPGTGYDIYISVGNAVYPLTYTAADDLDPTWSPDGNGFAFVRRANPGANGDIYASQGGGSVPTAPLTDDPGDDNAPYWAVDVDSDGDGLLDSRDAAPQDPDQDDDNKSDGPADPDGDGPITAGPDNCRTDPNPDQLNSDTDAQGDACDADDDNDGLADGVDGNTTDPDQDNDNRSDGPQDPDGNGPIAAGPDNCVTVPNSDQSNSDGDAQGDACDSDDDNDGLPDETDGNDTDPDPDDDLVSDGPTDPDGQGPINAGPDNCANAANAGQANSDGDAQGDACDSDDDNDTVPDETDACDTAAEDFDEKLDGDGCPDESTRTNVTIRYLARKHDVKGKVTTTPDRPSCEVNRQVTLFKVRRGKDAKIGQPDTTSSRGNYAFSLPNSVSGRVYVKVKRMFIADDQSVLDCGAKTSKTVGVS